MSEALEALQTLKFIDNPMKDYVLWKQSIEIIEQALKPKTVEEICEMLSEYLKWEVYYDNEKKVFYRLYPKTTSTVVNKYYITKRNEFHDTYGIVIALPTHIIYEISKFYMERGKKQ